MRVVLSGQETNMKTLKTDVIIPAYHPGEEFEKLLERLSAQKYPINKILVMNTEKKFWKVYAEQKRAMEQMSQELAQKKALVDQVEGSKAWKVYRAIKRV